MGRIYIKKHTYIYIYTPDYTLIAVVSYIRGLLVYKHTYPFAPEAASGTYSGEDIYKKHIYIYTRLYTNSRRVLHSRAIGVYTLAPEAASGTDSGEDIYIYIYTRLYTNSRRVLHSKAIRVYIYIHIYVPVVSAKDRPAKFD